MDFVGLVTHFQQLLKPNVKQKTNDNALSTELIPWNWVCSSLISILENYASGATEAIILSELQIKWDETPKDWNDNVESKITTLSTVGEVQTAGVLEVKVVSTHRIPDTHMWVITVQDFSGTKMDHYLHPTLTGLVEGPYPLLVEGRGIRIAGTRMSVMGSPPHPVLLPTVLVAVLLGTVAGVFDDHLTDPFETTPLVQLQQYRGTTGACAIAAKMLGVRGNSIYLSEPNAPNHVVLELPNAYRQLLQLIRKGEVLRLMPHVPPNFDLRHAATSIINYVPGTMICIQTANSALGDGMDMMGGPGIRDMRYEKTCMHISHIGPSMSGINVVGRVAKTLRNHPTADKLPRYPVQLSEELAGTVATVDVTVWDIAHQLRTLRQGMLVYAENLLATTPKDQQLPPKYNVIASREYNTRLRAVSTLPAILTSSLFPTSLLSAAYALTQETTSYLKQPANFIVRATILDYHTFESEPPVYNAHARCLRIAHLADERAQTWECRWCGTTANINDKGEWEKVFNLQWRISDGSAECWVHATAKAHEVILQVKPNAFAELDALQQRAALISAFSNTYLFSITMATEGQKKILRVDQLVPPNPIVETKKLISNLESFLW